MKSSFEHKELQKRVNELEKKISELQENELQYRKIIEHLPISVFVKDIQDNYRYILWNRELEKVFGMKASETLGKTDFDLFTKADEAKNIREVDNSVVKSGKTFDIPFEEISTPKNKCIYHTRKIPIFNEKGIPEFIVGCLEDVTEKVKFENSIRESEETHRLLIQNLEEMILFLDLQGNVKFANQAVEKTTGYIPSNLLGNNIIDFIKPEFKKTVLQNLSRRNSGDFRNFKYQIEIITKNKKPILIEANSSPIIKDHNIIGIMFIAIDITERNKVELELLARESQLKNQNEEFQALNQEYVAQNEELADSYQKLSELNKELVNAKSKAEESDKLKSAFLANMSHEIRTPMNAIVGFADLLKDEELPPEKTVKYVNIIDSNSHQLLALINDIIDISKIEAGQVSLSLSAININELMREMLSIFKTLASRKNIEITLHYTLPNAESNVLGDETRIKQILTNLLNNALKFTQEGKIDFGYKVVDNVVKFYVTDTGIGIAKESQYLVFERFRQIESHLTKKVGGTGLGLSISKALVELMNGTIGLESEYGKGSTFYFEIPYVPVTGEFMEEELKKNAEEITDWSKFTFLIAEDEEANYFYLEEIIRPTHAKILHAKDGIEALELFKSNPQIDLVIMDIKMPQMDGYEATRQIKMLNKKIHVIAQTAYAMADDKKKAFRAGCDSYIAKPINRQNLMIEMKFALKDKNKM